MYALERKYSNDNQHSLRLNCWDNLVYQVDFETKKTDLSIFLFPAKRMAIIIT